MLLSPRAGPGFAPERLPDRVILFGLPQEQFPRGLFGTIKDLTLPTAPRRMFWLPIRGRWLLPVGRMRTDTVTAL